VQNHYNVAERTSEDVVDYCEENGIVFVPYYPLKFDVPPTLGEIAESHDASPEQIALAWLLRRSRVMLPIPGTLSIEHARENLGALEIELTDDEFDALA
jgi:pyridoxine 4-dehydrogenase